MRYLSLLSLHGVHRLIELYMDNSYGDTREKLIMLRSMIEDLLSDKPNYRCKQCGFSSKDLYWLCPACNNWSTVRPIHGLIGD